MLLLKVIPKSMKKLKDYIRMVIREYEERIKRNKEQIESEVIDKYNKFKHISDKYVLGLLQDVESYSKFIDKLVYNNLYDKKYEKNYVSAFNDFTVDRNKVNRSHSGRDITINNNLVELDNVEK